MGLGIFSELRNLERARNRVSHLLETLKDCFLLSQGSDKNYVKMHDVVRDMAIYIASEGEDKFMVNHNVNSDEFSRNHSYEQYNHMSIVANKFDEHPRPISCPRLKLMMLKLRFKEGFKLQDDFFVGTSKLSVISLGGSGRNSLPPFPSSIQSNRDSYLEELPVKIGNLTNLTMLEYWNTGYRKLMRIPPGVLSRLVRLEELHVVGVKGCSYSTLRELESLSRLTALALDECSIDVIYRNLGLSSKLTRYALTVGGHYMGTSIMETYNKIIALQVTESTPLGDWIRLLLRNSKFVCLEGNGSKNVLVELQNVKDLILTDCDSLNIHYQNNIPFPKLERLKVSCPNVELLRLYKANNISALCSHQLPTAYFNKLETLEVQYCGKLRNLMSPSVAREVDIGVCPKMKAFIQQGTVSTPSLESVNNHDELKVVDTTFNSKVSCPNLEVLKLYEANSITALCSHQLPTAYFSKLVTLEVENCGKLRNLMSPSVARGLLNLRKLWIEYCQSMEEVITEQQGEEIMTYQPLFPVLEELSLYHLPKLGHLILTRHVLEFPFLKEVVIDECLEMKAFIQQELSAH
ncbi:hypothetical protein CQW23_25033 [Capsicum baccatum]|uniref:Disease resistance protein At4g27190-like leucine-rich repeats domain-containing protein n=1 Tax=Capsicum baccatum TaxID=33114 RepID=A0A2G2VWL5_CAPBA|nr:hypothetical protein CQW23_25033 [Capsicum baccatum]